MCMSLVELIEVYIEVYTYMYCIKLYISYIILIKVITFINVQLCGISGKPEKPEKTPFFGPPPKIPKIPDFVKIGFGRPRFWPLFGQKEPWKRRKQAFWIPRKVPFCEKTRFLTSVVLPVLPETGFLSFFSDPNRKKLVSRKIHLLKDPSGAPGGTCCVGGGGARAGFEYNYTIEG